jgi:hypothetical protein
MWDLVFGTGMHREFVQAYASDVNYPRADVGIDLVAQFDSFGPDPGDFRWRFLAFTERAIYSFAEFVAGKSHEVIEDTMTLNLSVTESAYRVGFPQFENEPRHPLLQLANLPLPVYITTSPFTFLETALIYAGKAPRSDFQRGGNRRDRIPPVDDQVSVDHPLVYHLFGIESYPRSIVLSRDDIGRFFTSSPELDRSSIMKGIIRSGSYVLAGFQRNDWEFKAVAHTLLKPYNRTRPRGVIQVDTDQGDQEPLALLNRFYMELGLRLYHGSATELLSNLTEVDTGGL